jgi:hypothetical protein
MVLTPACNGIVCRAALILCKPRAAPFAFAAGHVDFHQGAETSGG